MSSRSVQVRSDSQKPCEPPFPNYFNRRPAIEGFVPGAHPSIGQVAIVREQETKILVDREKMAGTVEHVAILRDRLPFAVASQGRSVGGGQPEDIELFLGAHVPVVKQFHQHSGDRRAIDGLIHFNSSGFHHFHPLL